MWWIWQEDVGRDGQEWKEETLTLSLSLSLSLSPSSCWTCHGCGQVPCEMCLSRGQLKCYIKLTISWKTHKLEHVVERTALPDDLIKQAQGVVVFQDQHIRVGQSLSLPPSLPPSLPGPFPLPSQLFVLQVAPVTEFPDSDVNVASSRLVQTHSTAFPTERILMQVIPWQRELGGQ